MKKVLLFILTLFMLSNINIKNYRKQIDKTKNYIENSFYNKEYAILIDYSKHSSFDRLFLVDLKNECIIKSFKVLHGRGNSKLFSLEKKFSNEKGSNKSSIGFSVIKSREYSSWGINVKYIIEGIDITNNNNKVRNIVLHSWNKVPDVWLYPIPLPQSKGCPTISNKSMIYIDNFIKKQQNKNIIIYSFN